MVPMPDRNGLNDRHPLCGGATRSPKKRGALPMQRRCFLMLASLVLAACADRSREPVGVQQPPSPLPLAGALAQVSQDDTPDQMAVARVVPGFGGYFLDGSG